MPVMDKREPGVYVTIEDVSYVASSIEVGRSVFGVGICPKGPHNQVVSVTSQEEFQRKFGRPDFHKVSQSVYVFDKAMQYTGRGLFVRVVPDDATVANVSIKENTSPIITVGTSDEFTFVEGSTEVSVDTSVFDSFVEGEWIYASDTIDSSPEARQIISKNTVTKKYILDSKYTGATSGWTSKSVKANKYTPYIQTSDTLSWSTNFTSEMDVDSSVVFTFYATGAGKEYNNLKIKAVRNVELEKMYLDENNLIKYPYLFMNVGIYEEADQDNGGFGDKLVEGPWLVSLTNKAPDGTVIRNISSGSVMYIQEVINSNSELVKCIAGQGVAKLSLPDSTTNNITSANNRFQVLLMMSAGQPVSTVNYVPVGNALLFNAGFDGTTGGQPLYTTAGNLYQDDEIWGLCKLAYEGSLTSVDGSIEQLREVTYPLYEPDYVVSGGFPTWVDNCALKN